MRHLCPQRLLLHADGSMCPAVRCGCSYAICEGVQHTDRSMCHPCPQRLLLHVDGSMCPAVRCGAPVPSVRVYSLQTAACAILARCGCCSMWMVQYVSSGCCGAPVPSVRVYSIQTAACAICVRL